MGKKTPIGLRLKRSFDVDPEGCWIWNKVALKGGYGRIRIDDKMVLAHRASYENFVGPIPEGHQVLHRCDKPSCINPSCLFLGTQVDNMADMVAKGRQVRANAVKTHCKRGHPFAGENLQWDKGRRVCRTCKNMRQRKEWFV